MKNESQTLFPPLGAEHAKSMATEALLQYQACDAKGLSLAEIILFLGM
ncbi:hypothetical protein [Methylomonas lenta]|nr:hypothetical protein [Methylomonas lenta]